jgi:hypothetical protein
MEGGGDCEGEGAAEWVFVGHEDQFEAAPGYTLGAKDAILMLEVQHLPTFMCFFAVPAPASSHHTI